MKCVLSSGRMCVFVLKDRDVYGWKKRELMCQATEERSFKNLSRKHWMKTSSPQHSGSRSKLHFPLQWEKYSSDMKSLVSEGRLFAPENSFYEHIQNCLYESRRVLKLLQSVEWNCLHEISTTSKKKHSRLLKYSWSHRPSA